MVSSVTTDSQVYEVRHVGRVHKYHWPAVQLNLWMLIMLVAACTIIGVFGSFIGIQQQLLLPVPWYFPYYITVSCVAICFVIVLLWLIFQRRLLPSIVMLGGFMLFVLWLTGLVVVAIELWGPAGNVNNSCQLAVFDQNPTGQYLSTLAWLEQRAICQGWYAVFAFGIIGTVFLVWIMVMAYQVFANDGP